METQNWHIFFVENADGDQISFSFSEDVFCAVLHTYRPNVDGRLVLQRIKRLLSETPRKRAAYPLMRRFYRGYRKCKAGRKIRIFFKVDEENLVITFGAHHRGRLGEIGKKYH